VFRRELLIGAVAFVLAPGARAQGTQATPPRPAPGGPAGPVRPPIWGPPYTRKELKDAERRFGIRFPPDVFELLMKQRFARSPDWTKDEADIRDLLAWPLEGILIDIEKNDFWAPHWGIRPASLQERLDAAQRLVKAAPKLIPLAPNIYVPQRPFRRGNPIFFVFLTDVRYYAADLADYVERVSTPGQRRPVIGPRQQIPFWTELSEVRRQPPKRQ